MIQENSFSWERMSLLARYYMPAIKKQLLIYLIIITVYFTAGVLSQMPYWFSGLFMMLWGICQFGFAYMFYLAPIAFSRYDDNALNTLIPARGDEKALFVTGYSLVIVPLFIVAVTSVYAVIARFIPGYDIDLLSNGFDNNAIEREAWDTFFPGWSLWIYKITGYFWMTAVVLYVVTISRSNKVIKAILATIVIPLLSGIIAGIIGFVYVIYNKTTFEFFRRINDSDLADSSLPSELLNEISSWLIGYQGVMVVIGIVCLVLTWRKICHRQV
ncbi:MAG: hypothetical protein K2K68_10405 [Duncaniella sp.]|nr:hypothetical protein [Duncaniella sp.]MDE6582900.1 hypothetical protein [Duncaniella sp.]